MNEARNGRPVIGEFRTADTTLKRSDIKQMPMLRREGTISRPGERKAPAPAAQRKAPAAKTAADYDREAARAAVAQVAAEKKLKAEKAAEHQRNLDAIFNQVAGKPAA